MTNEPHPDWARRDESPAMQLPKGAEENWPADEKARAYGYRLMHQLKTAVTNAGYEPEARIEDEQDAAGYTTWVMYARDDTHVAEVRIRLEDR